MKKTVLRDLERIYNGLSEEEKKKFSGRSFLFTGGAGFLGFYFISFLAYYKELLKVKKIICLDNFQTGCPKWLRELERKGDVSLYSFNIISDDIENIPEAKEADYILHMASIASPIYYRKYPIETMDGNIWGLRRLLNFYCDKPIQKLVFFSSSEIYGDPSDDMIPTPEEYRGNVDCQGPRACYDEAKRFGETMCYLFHEANNMPISIIRPFNNFGPGMRLNDARVSADFANDIRLNRDIIIYSDGQPTRTFCYITDTITGYFKVLFYASDKLETFNIGSDSPEISVSRLAEIFRNVGMEHFDYQGEILYKVSSDKEYLTNNPNRRCPDLHRAKSLLNYCPRVSVEEGVLNFLEYIKECDEDELIW